MAELALLLLALVMLGIGIAVYNSGDGGPPGPLSPA